MCYRVATPPKDKVEKKFKKKIDNFDLFVQYHHVTGFDKPLLPAITSENPEIIQSLQWKSMDDFNTLNAKSETLFESRYFKNFASRRCLIIISGFYEHREVNKKKYPYFIRLKNKEPFALGGIISSQNTISILTTEANELMSMIHNTKLRMPLILPEERYSTWLRKDLTKEEILNEMQPFSHEEMEAFTISKLLTDTKKNRNVEEVYQPFDYPELNPPLSLF